MLVINQSMFICYYFSEVCAHFKIFVILKWCFVMLIRHYCMNNSCSLFYAICEQLRKRNWSIQYSAMQLIPYQKMTKICLRFIFMFCFYIICILLCMLFAGDLYSYEILMLLWSCDAFAIWYVYISCTQCNRDVMNGIIQ